MEQYDSCLNMSISSLISSATSNPRQEESQSLFGDGVCGEPLTTQQVVLDFTPSDKVDTDFVQKKCCSFWDFIRNSPEIQGLMVSPEAGRYTDPSTLVSYPETESSDIIPCARTALSMLEFVEEKGLIDRTFEAKLPQSMCSLGSREYLEKSSTTLAPVVALHGQKTACKCTTVCKTCSQKKPTASASYSLRDMCRKMQAWDKDHPKYAPYLEQDFAVSRPSFGWHCHNYLIWAKRGTKFLMETENVQPFPDPNIFIDILLREREVACSPVPSSG